MIPLSLPVHRALHRLILLSLAIALITLACTPPAADAHPDDHDEDRTEVFLTPEQVSAVGLTTSRMEKRGLTSSLRVNGRLVLPPDKNAEVSVLVGGRVRNIAVREGQLVQQGQVLATLESLELLELEQAYLEATASLVVLDADLRRKQELHDEQISSTATLQRTQAERDIAHAKQAGLAARLRLFGLSPEQVSADNIGTTFTVRSPITGSVQHIGITTGQAAEPNRPLFNVVDNSALHIDLNIFEQDVSRVHPGQQVIFGHAGEAIGHHSATVYAVNKAFESDQQAVLAHAKLDDDGEELFSGMYIDALIMTDSITAWSLPDEAITSNGDEHYIFVERGEGHFVMVPVGTGASELGYTEIKPLEPVDTLERIVVKGAYYLLSEMTKGSGGHDH